MYFSSGVDFALCTISFMINFRIKPQDFKKINAIGIKKLGSLVINAPIPPNAIAMIKIGNHKIILIIKKVILSNCIEG